MSAPVKPAAIDSKIVDALAAELREPGQALAIALDFDGVCKLFTDHKHQIMFTLLFLYMRELQRVPFDVFRRNYIDINFRSKDYAGKERFLCVNALAQRLHQLGYPCELPGVARTVADLQSKGLKLNEKNLLPYEGAEDVARLIAWSREVNTRVGQLTEIGLTAGIRDHIFTPFQNRADFYVVSTATEEPLRKSLEKEGITFIRRFIGQETASKAEALVAFGRLGYRGVFMFGDSVEDERASRLARAEVPAKIPLVFVPVIPGDEERCFQAGRRIVEAVDSLNLKEAEKISANLYRDFQGREAGSSAASPMCIRQ